MTPGAHTVEAYFDSLPPGFKVPMQQLRNTIKEHLPKGYSETLSYGAVGYVVPHTLYPAGYHCNPRLPLPFVSIAAQKNFIALYHMGLYAMPDVLEWFTAEYPKHSKTKLDMGKSCIRFKKPDQIPYALVGTLMKKITPKKWIEVYEANLKK